MKITKRGSIDLWESVKRVLIKSAEQRRHRARNRGVVCKVVEVWISDQLNRDIADKVQRTVSSGRLIYSENKMESYSG